MSLAASCRQIPHVYLPFRSSQDGRCGPIALERDTVAKLDITLRRGNSSVTALPARLFCRVAHHEDGACTVSLHSGIKVGIYLIP